VSTLEFCRTLSEKSLKGNPISVTESTRILEDRSIPLLELLQAAYAVRSHYYRNRVSIHIINNAKNGNCPEDCAYCVQASSSDSPIADYPIKSESEIMGEAKNAYDNGAYRYCMVFAGRGPSKGRVKKLAGMIKNIKKNYPIQVCLSPGLIDDDDAKVLKEAGLDRLNHNLNTSESHYKTICSTHTYADRLNTLYAAQKAGLETCSGMIVGMGESRDDIIEVVLKLRELNTPSIPVNFYIPLEGAPLKEKIDSDQLTPDYCLRILCLVRFINPTAEIRMAAGRELHLRSLQVMGLYPANSLFMDGYLNTQGTTLVQTLEMIKDGGFDIDSDKELENLLATAEINRKLNDPINSTDSVNGPVFKDVAMLRPELNLIN
jgi:biotin synthase